MTQTQQATHAVWYAAAGCIPDCEYPEFVGTLEECYDWILANQKDYARPDVVHDTYYLSVDEYESAGEK